jgi:choline dehydrogenase-like flavoprotein
VLIDARSLAPDEELEADVCIVGAGPAGIVLALELLETGAQICMLESGGREPQGLPGGESIGYPYFRLATAGVRAFGGSSLHWGSGDGDYWHAAPLDRLDFESRPGIPHSGWPFGRMELVPFYKRAAALCGLGPFVYSADPLDDDDVARHLAVRPARLVSSFLEVSYSTFTQYFVRLIAAGNLRLLLHATAAEVTTEDRGRRVDGVRAFSSPGKALGVRARTTILAAGGIENARLLLLSSRAHPSGLGNQHDLVGRFFMERVAVRSGVLVPSSETLLDQTHLYAKREQAGARVVPTLRLHESVVRREELLNVAFLLDARPRASAAGGVRSVATLRRVRQLEPRPKGVLGYARNVVADAGDVAHTIRHRRAPAIAPEEVLPLRVQAEQAPNPASRITLSEDRDSFELRKPRLNWQLGDLDRLSIRRTQEIVGDELRAGGIGSVADRLGDEDPPALIYGLYHHMGTTKMNDNPKLGVVDVDCEVHGWPDLFVTGTSVFPTAGWANPTFTVLALAIRLADHLKRRLGTI